MPKRIIPPTGPRVVRNRRGDGARNVGRAVPNAILENQPVEKSNVVDEKEARETRLIVTVSGIPTPSEIVVPGPHEPPRNPEAPFATGAVILVDEQSSDGKK